MFSICNNLTTTAIIIELTIEALIVFYIISVARYYISKKKFLTCESEETKNKLVVNKRLYLASILFLVMTSVLFALISKLYIIVIILIIFFVFVLIRFYKSFTVKELNLNESDLLLTISSTLVMLFCVFCMCLIFIAIIATGNAVRDIYSNIAKVVYSFSTPSEISKDERLQSINELVDLYNSVTQNDYHVDTKKITKSVEKIYNQIISNASEIDTDKVVDAVNEIIQPLVSSNSNINEETVLDVVKQITEKFR